MIKVFRALAAYVCAAAVVVLQPVGAGAYQTLPSSPTLGASAAASPAPPSKSQAKGGPIAHQTKPRPSGKTAVSTAQAGVPVGGAWTSKGPAPIVDERCCGTVPSSNFGNASGRVTSLVADPTNTSVLFVGTAGGGVWKTTNSGSSWITATDQQPTLAIGSLAIDPTGQVIYAGTGEDNDCFDCQSGKGILKSTNGGANWTQVTSQFSGDVIGGLAIDRTTAGTSQHVLAATGSGIFLSTDGGVTWPAVPASPGQATTIVQDPTNASLFWAARSNYCGVTGSIDQSSDGGATWHTSFTSHQMASRIGLGVGPGGVAYAAFARCPTISASLMDIEKTTNYGGSWSAISITSPGMTDYFFNGDGEQGWYDNVVGVDPANASNAAFGGVDVMVTKDGGSTFTNVTNSYVFGISGGFVHADNHAILFTPTRKTSVLWLGNDGGVYQSNDLGGTSQSSDWINRNSNLNTIQFFSGSALSATRFLGGAQDNGSSGNLPGSAALPAWQGYWSGDGGFAAIDPTSDTIYTENQNLFIYQGHSTLTSSSTSPYNSFTQASPCSGSYKNGPDPACSDPVAWAAPFQMDPTNPRRLIAATNKVYETTVGGSPSGTVGYTNCFFNTCAWNLISPVLTNGGGAYISTVAIGPPGQTGIIFTGATDGTVYMRTNDGVLWINLTGTGLVGGITGLAYNPFNLSELWVTTTSTTDGVFHTTNAGAPTTWTSLPGTTSKPNAIVLDRINPSTIYIGTDLGASVCTTCGGATPAPNWAPFGTGLPTVQVLGMTATLDSKNVVAWTHGRGAWTIPVLPAPCLTVTIAGGGRHSLAVTPGGLVYAWGGGTSGQLGNGLNSDSNVPVPVSTSSGIPAISSVAAGGFHSVSRTTGGAVWAWGNNASGGLGNPNYPGGSNVPVQVLGVNGSGFLTGIGSVSAGDYNFSVAAKTADGTVWTWGDNTKGDLGDGTTTNRSTPVQVKGPGGVGYLTGIIQVSAGLYHVLALRGDGTVWAWGINGAGELGKGKTSTMETTPVQVVAPGGHGFLTGVIAIGTHSDTSLAVLSDGTVYSWGDNNYGQLGNNTGGTGTFSATPVKVSVLAGLSLNSSVITGGESSLAADPSTGKAWGWGWNVYGQVGDGTQTQRLIPVPVKSSAQLNEVAAGDWHSMALAADGKVWAWGYNYYGQLGNGVSGVNVNPTPAPITNLIATQRQSC